jgi:hypothetical protein
MDEAAWMAATDPAPMLGFIRGRASVRKQRLAACACCRDMWASAGDGQFDWVIRVGERWADDECTPAEVDDTYDAGWRAYEAKSDTGDHGTALRMFRTILCVDTLSTVSADPLFFLAEERPAQTIRTRLLAIGRDVWDRLTLGVAYRRHVPDPQSWCPLIRDVFGNPFRPVTFDPSWQSPTVLSLAQGIYEDRAFDRLPILADALADAGCDDAELLGHLRGPGPHVRGCWALDLILGKE